jgi:hypothetical protein
MIPRTASRILGAPIVGCILVATLLAPASTVASSPDEAIQPDASSTVQITAIKVISEGRKVLIDGLGLRMRRS